jgi:hypothetical protein
MENDDTQVHAGCVAGSAVEGAGCVEAAEEFSQAAATPKAGPASAGCAATPATDECGTQATPPTTVREFERALRGLGFTRLQAASIARQGFSGASATAPEPDESEHLRAALEQLEKLARSFESTS